MKSLKIKFIMTLLKLVYDADGFAGNAWNAIYDAYNLALTL
jgi:hypothetical protein